MEPRSGASAQEICRNEAHKKERKWLIAGNGEGWLYNGVFPTKWKVLVAIDVFNNGGRVSDYRAATPLGEPVTNGVYRISRHPLKLILQYFLVSFKYNLKYYFK